MGVIGICFQVSSGRCNKLLILEIEKTFNMKTMQLFIFALSVFVTLIACEESREESLPIDNLFGESITLEIGKSSDIQADLLTITFDKLVEDSRCPTGVECFWEGQATVQFLVNETTTLDLIMRAGHEDLAKDTLDNYIYTLLDVSPYPNMTDNLPLPEDAYTVEIQVDEL